MSLGKILVALYSGFKKRRWLLFILLSLLTVSMAITSLNIRFTEDPLQLFPQRERVREVLKHFQG
jgi:hypothetical protein